MFQVAFKNGLINFCLIYAACVADLAAAEFNLGDQSYLTASPENWLEASMPVFGIEMHGDISTGDFNKFLQSLARAPDERNRWSIALYSPGGDVLEAIRIGKFLRKGLFRAGLQGTDTNCVSACFLIWVGAVERAGALGINNKFGIHRPRYEETLFASLSVEEASKAYDRLDASVREYLSDMGVPTHWIDKMFAIPSNEVYWLSPREIKELAGRTAYYDEWIRAKCPGELTPAEWADRQSQIGSQDYQDYLTERWKNNDTCVESALYTERKNARRIVEEAAAKAAFIDSSDHPENF